MSQRSFGLFLSFDAMVMSIYFNNRFIILNSNLGTWRFVLLTLSCRRLQATLVTAFNVLSVSSLKTQQVTNVIIKSVNETMRLYFNLSFHKENLLQDENTLCSPVTVSKVTMTYAQRREQPYSIQIIFSWHRWQIQTLGGPLVIIFYVIIIS